MMPEIPNRLHSRRGFLGKVARDAQVAGATGALAALGLRSAEAGAGKPNPWAYDISRFLTTDPALIRYQAKTSFASPTSGARALALGPDGHLWLGAGRSVLELSPEGALLSEFSTAQEVRALAVSDGTLYVALTQQVAVLDRRGTQRMLWDVPAGKPYFTSIAAGGNDVFVADAGNRIVHRYDASGQARNRIGARDRERNVPGIIVPSPFFAVVLGRDGLLRVTNTGRHRVELYLPDGGLELAWGNPGAAIENFCGCCNPVDVALLPDGRPVTFEKGIPRVKVYSATGEFECVVAGAESFPENARACGPNDCTLGGMAGVVDAAGRVLILDFVTNTVRVMERKA